MLFHRHDWGEVGRVFCSPPTVKNMTGTDNLARDAMFGLTSIEIVCRCGETKTATRLGNHVESDRGDQ